MRAVKTKRDLPVCDFNRAYLRVVEINDREVSQVFNLGLYRLDKLEEWWLVPDNGVAWTKADLANALLNEEKELLDFVRPGGALHEKATRLIAYSQTPELTAYDLDWDFSLRQVEGVGSVISIVCGTRNALKEVYQRGWRERPAL